MNLTVRRFRQITSAINRRLYFEERRAKTLVAWQTRQLASFIAAGYMVDGDNPALSAAQDLAIDDIEHEQLQEIKKLIAEAPPVIEVKNGSFERFLGTFGAPSRWAGK